MRIVLLFASLAFLFLLSVTSYVLFYWGYMPRMRHVSPVYLHFTPQQRPWAEVKLQGLRESVKYDVSLELELPDQRGLSERLGVFMIGWETQPTAALSDERPCLLRYRSELVRSAELLITLPLLLLGWRQETFTQRIFLAEAMRLPANLTGLRLTLSRPDLPIREARLHVVANLRGLRYLMYYWTWTMALFITLFFFGTYSALTLIIAMAVYLMLNRDSEESHGESEMIYASSESYGDGDDCAFSESYGNEDNYTSSESYEKYDDSDCEAGPVVKEYGVPDVIDLSSSASSRDTTAEFVSRTESSLRLANGVRQRAAHEHE